MTDPTEPDLTEIASELYDLPFHRAHGVEIVEATADRGRTRLPFDESLIGNPEVPAVHGGVISALADLTGAVPLVAAAEAYTPTVDLRVDYLNHAGHAPLVGDSTVSRRGASIGVSDVVIRSEGQRCAVARGVYKIDR